MGKYSELKGLRKEELYEGSNLALENSKNLLASSKLLESSNNIGHANSLLILSLEEAVKSFILFTHASGIYKNDQILIDVFTKHKKKHEVWAFIESVNQLMKMFFVEVGKLKVLESQKIVRTEECGSLLVKEVTGKLKNWVSNKSNPMQEIQEWYNGANSTKNIGLYVDYVDGKWSTPSCLNKEEYIESKEYVVEFINNLEKLINVCESEITDLCNGLKKQFGN